jgi:hypothetical protein
MAKRAGRNRDAATLTASIARSAVETDGLPISSQQSFAIDVGQIGAKEMKKALADSKIIASLLQEHPKEMAAIANDVLAGRTDAAQQLAERIGLTEEAFQRKGGGLLSWLVIAFLAGAIIAAAATTKA